MNKYILEFAYKDKIIKQTVSASSFFFATLGSNGAVPKTAKLVKATENGYELDLNSFPIKRKQGN